MWDFARRPRWILSHVLVLVLIVVMISLGLWQLRRYDEKQTLNDSIRARDALPTESISALMPTGATRESTRELQWRRVRATGTYRVADELVVSNRIVSGQPGFWVLTPLVTGDGSVIPVVRGFVFRPEFEARGLASVPAPAGEVTIEGALQASPTSGRFGEERADTGMVPAISQVDTGRLAERWGATVTPLWLRLDRGAGAPSPQGPLHPVPAPPLSKGPHLSYAAQWFIFSVIALVGYPVILRRQAYGRDRSADDDWPAADTIATGEQQTARQNGAAQGTIV
jgi:cytochrome oxidase assembly protein ShyY1